MPRLRASIFLEPKVLTTDVAVSVREIADLVRARLAEAIGESELFLLSATPPCQGMSKNGIGTLLRSRQSGFRPKVDPRNQLYVPALKLVSELRPRWFFFENVCRMMNTFEIAEDGTSGPLCRAIESTLAGLGYAGAFAQVQLADYGLPQTRLRTVGIFRKGGEKGRSYLPPPSHSQAGSHGRKKWVTLRDVAAHLPPLDSKSRKTAQSTHHPLHRVPVWRPELYSWMNSTPEGHSALDNITCCDCHFDNGEDAMTCVRCGKPLPRPSVTDAGAQRLIKGFPSAYKRMFLDKPASTVTTRSAYACSDHKVHPIQNRVLSSLEVALVQGIDPNTYSWSTDPQGPIIPDTLVREVIGECVPPIFSSLVGKHLIQLELGQAQVEETATQFALF